MSRLYGSRLNNYQLLNCLTLLIQFRLNRKGRKKRSNSEGRNKTIVFVFSHPSHCTYLRWGVNLLVVYSSTQPPDIHPTLTFQPTTVDGGSPHHKRIIKSKQRNGGKNILILFYLIIFFMLAVFLYV